MASAFEQGFQIVMDKAVETAGNLLDMVLGDGTPGKGLIGKVGSGMDMLTEKGKSFIAEKASSLTASVSEFGGNLKETLTPNQTPEVAVDTPKIDAPGRGQTLELDSSVSVGGDSSSITSGMSADTVAQLQDINFEGATFSDINPLEVGDLSPAAGMGEVARSSMQHTV